MKEKLTPEEKEIPQEVEPMVLTRKKEIPQGVDLKVVAKGGRELMFVFNSKTKNECSAYNSAIMHVTYKYGQQIFHQEGVKTELGHHGWEAWGASMEKMQKMIPEIEEYAQEYLLGL